MKFSELVEQDSIFGKRSLAYGMAVTRVSGGTREFLGVVVEVTADRKAVWIRRTYDPADVSVWYAVRELELASQDDLASVARQFLNRQYRESMDVRQAVEA